MDLQVTIAEQVAVLQKQQQEYFTSEVRNKIKHIADLQSQLKKIVSDYQIKIDEAKKSLSELKYEQIDINL